MTLDLTKILPQIGDMVGQLKSGSQEQQEHLKTALNKISDKATNIEKLKRKIAAGKTTWLVAGPTEELDLHYPAPIIPDEYIILATDGSHIDFDRNKSVWCFVINIGSVLLKYGSQPEASLASVPHLYCSEDDLQINDETNKNIKRAIDSTLLGIKRGVEECKKLAQMASTLPRDSMALAVLDGTLVLWGLEAYPGFVTDSLLRKEFLPYFNEIRKLNNDRHLSLASYISLPRSSEVVNTLRIAICPQEVPNCDRCTEINGVHACDIVSGIQDYRVFSEVLKDGERSAVFFSRSTIVNDYYGENTVYFFYLKVSDEIARVEVPEWVVRDKGGILLNLAHALVLDQCRRGQGYPVALSEAHEKAVVTGADREEFWCLVEEALEEEKIQSCTSIKSRSKRTRWI